jgi:tetratricopeptide (TPR) repeat protein
VLSNTLVRETEIQFGRPLPWYVRELQRPGLYLKLRELVAVGRESAEYTQEIRRTRYVAQCWGLVHYLLFGMPDDHAGAENDTQLTKLLLEGTPSATALEQSFGSLDALETAYRRYVQQGMFKYSRLQVDIAMPSKNFPTRTLPPADAAVVRAGFLASTGRPDEARRAITDARSADPTLGGSYEVEGDLHDRERDTEGARTAFSKAADLNSANFYTYYRLATLLTRPNADSATLATIQQQLSKAMALNAGYGPASALLATVLLQINQPDHAVALTRRGGARTWQHVAPAGPRQNLRSTGATG